MNTIINAWGTEGVMNSVVLYALACMGIRPQNGTTIVRHLNFGTDSNNISLFKSVKDAFTEHYNEIYGENADIKYSDNVTLTSVLSIGNRLNVTLHDKYEDKYVLSLGCSIDDMRKNVTDNADYSIRFLESYFSSVNDLEYLYTDQDVLNILGNDIIIVNTGDISGDPVSAVFIPLECKIPNLNFTQSVFRYNVLSGPYGKASHKVCLRYPELIGDDVPNEIEAADIPTIAQMIKKRMQSLSKEEKDLLNRDIVTLTNEYSNLFSNNMPLNNDQIFIENLSSINGSVNAAFINLKTNGTKLLEPDIISQNLESNNGRRFLNIINLINALSIIEIERYSTNYVDGGVYAFGSDMGDKYIPKNLFVNDDLKKIFQFIVTTLMINVFVLNILDNHTDLKLPSEFGSKFSSKGADSIKQISEEFYFPVLNVFRSMDNHSQQAELFSADIYSCLDYARGDYAVLEKIKSEYTNLSDFVKHIIKVTVKSFAGDQSLDNAAYVTNENELFGSVTEEILNSVDNESSYQYALRIIKAASEAAESFTNRVIV